VLSSYTIPQEVKEGLRYHVPSELYAATSLESAGYHLVQVKMAGNSYRTSLTFNAFGAKVDVDCVGIGHPPCILLLCVTTSKVDQTKAMTTKGTLDNLEKLMRERYTDFPPVHKVLVTTDVVDSNVDPIGIEKTGMTILDRSSILDLDKEMAKIPSRITTRV
jgi:hypothetical protein